VATAPAFEAAATDVEPSSSPAVEEAESEPVVALSDADVDRIARRVLALGGEEVLERVAREVLRAAASERASGGGEAGAGDSGRE
jgi:hypothetical protein